MHTKQTTPIAFRAIISGALVFACGLVVADDCFAQANRWQWVGTTSLGSATGSSDASWLTQTNWQFQGDPVPVTPPQGPQNFYFGDPDVGDRFTELDGNRSTNNILFDADHSFQAGAIAGGQSANSLTIGGGMDASSASTDIVFGSGVNLLLGQNQTWDVAGTVLVQGDVSSTSAFAPRTLTLTGNADFQFNGNVNSGSVNMTGSGNTSVVGVVSGSGNLIKNGVGTLTLLADNSYTGTTTISGGTTIINGDSSSATGAMTVSSGAVLTGSGTIGGTVDLSAGSTLTGEVIIVGDTDIDFSLHSVNGNSIGVQEFKSDLAYDNSAEFVWQLASNSTDTSQFDRVLLDGGDLSFDGSTTFTFDLGASVDLSDRVFFGRDQSWTIFSGASSVTGLENLSFEPFDVEDGLIGTFAFSSVGDDVVLNFTTAIPEPGTAMLLGGLTIGMLTRRRRS